MCNSVCLSGNLNTVSGAIDLYIFPYTICLKKVTNGYMTSDGTEELSHRQATYVLFCELWQPQQILSCGAHPAFNAKGMCI
jgi:hypothetical protein